MEIKVPGSHIKYTKFLKNLVNPDPKTNGGLDFLRGAWMDATNRSSLWDYKGRRYV
jgi:hypothetical protein